MGEKKAIIFSTHILEEVEAVCSRAIIIDRGQIVANGTPQELRQKSDLAGAVSLRVSGVHADCVKQRLGRLPTCAKRADRQGRSDAQSRRAFFRKAERRTASWPASVAEAAMREGWQIEELHTEEGRLDEVFRSITMPDTDADRRTTKAVNALANIKTIAKRELGGYFASPVAYVFIVIFLLLCGFFTFMVGGFFERGRRRLGSFFIWHPWLYLFLVPAVGMRLWAEERRVGTIELLLTMPITPWQAIVGKFLASWLFLALALVLTFPVVITVNYLGHPDNGVIFAVRRQLAAWPALTWRSAAMTSAMTRNQVVSFISRS